MTKLHSYKVILNALIKKTNSSSCGWNLSFVFLLVFPCYQRVRGDSRRWRSLIKPGRDLPPAVWRSVAATAPRASTPSWSCTWNTHSKVQPLCVSSIIIKYTVTTAILRSLLDCLQSYRSAAGWRRSVIKVKAKERLIVFLVFWQFSLSCVVFPAARRHFTAVYSNGGPQQPQKYGENLDESLIVCDDKWISQSL